MLLVGFDLVEIERIRKSMRNPRFCGRILGNTEYSQLAERGFSVQSVAASFCAKEAFSKAVGTGLSGFDLREAQLIRLKSGKPELLLSGDALRLAKGREFSVSVTHTTLYASAVVAALGTELPHEELTPGLIRLQEHLPPRDPEGNKGDFGRLLCICGSEGMAGAAVMSTRAAVRCGAGLVELALPRSIYPVAAAQLCEPVFCLLETSPDGEPVPAARAALGKSIGKASAILIGCGLGKSAAAFDEVARVLRESLVPVVLDADGINLAAEHIDILKTARAPLILTPHPGEMARLLRTDASDVQARRSELALNFARMHGVILVLKGAGTLIASPNGDLVRNSTGNPGMAKGGSGDVLAGMIASFTAQGMEPFEAAVNGVYLHGLAGDCCAERLSRSAMLPTDLIEELPGLFLKIGR